MEREVDYGGNMPGSFANFDLDTLSWRTSQRSFFEELEEFSGTWPRSGMIVNGIACQLQPSAPLTAEIDSGSWPTPTAHNAKEGAYPAEYLRHSITLAAHVGGPLNPRFTEWLMGYPDKWTDLEESETP